MAENEKWVCISCGYIYDPEKGDPQRGITAGTAFDELPDSWTCPLCYADKDSFDLL